MDKITNRVAVSKAEFDTCVMKLMGTIADEFEKAVGSLSNSFVKIYEDIIPFEDTPFELYTSLSLLVPNNDISTKAMVERTFDESSLKSIWTSKYSFGEGNGYIYPKLSFLRNYRKMLEQEYDNANDKKSFLCYVDDSKHPNYKQLVSYKPFTNWISSERKNTDIFFPVVLLKYETVDDLLFNFLVPHKMCPKKFRRKEKDLFHDMTTLYEYNNEWVMYSKGKPVVSGEVWEEVRKMVSDDPDNGLVDALHFMLVQTLKKYYKEKIIGGIPMEDIKERLLNCENKRAHIEPYDEKILTDPNRGHWDLWTGQDGSRYFFEADDILIARDPVQDIKDNGVIAIDFGTKSTIVAYMSDTEKTILMGIGEVKSEKALDAKRFENPTAMEFISLNKFIEAYCAKDGRPETEWADLCISHDAVDKFLNCKSDQYYAFMNKIKQWAGEQKKQYMIRSINGEDHLLPAFADITDNDFDPIEIYAYYIGLYINNMHNGHGIFLNYYISFPVTYEKDIRAKIVRSFEKGIKKSFPESIVRNEEIMKKFHINGNISEPAAYAACALKEYGFDPEGDEKVLYGIFDFGGGTTDFDFGIWGASAKKRYDYTIEHLGEGGDRYLGGENLLEAMAFEVFMDNEDIMRQNGYNFTLPAGYPEFAGADTLLSSSQEAEKNMHNLMEILRPFWEHTDEFFTEYAKKEHDYDIEEFTSDDCDDEAETCEVDLYNKNGEMTSSVSLKVDVEKLSKLLEDQIRKGVDNFFHCMTQHFPIGTLQNVERVYIFLAGNSCKSPIVKRVFEEEINAWTEQIRKKLNITEEIDDLFEIFPPLGTEEAYRKMESLGIQVNRSDFERPTCKTGVAFGLIQCRDGGRIEKINVIPEDSFNYFIGWIKKGKFDVFKVPDKITAKLGKPDLNVWYKFIEADVGPFALYYTTLPQCTNGQLVVEGNAQVRRVSCDIDTVDENAFVYIRAVSPTKFEYAVSGSDDVDKDKMGEIFTKELS